MDVIVGKKAIYCISFELRVHGIGLKDRLIWNLKMSVFHEFMPFGKIAVLFNMLDKVPRKDKPLRSLVDHFIVWGQVELFNEIGGKL